jgi:hypothetical protein
MKLREKSSMVTALLWVSAAETAPECAQRRQDALATMTRTHGPYLADRFARALRWYVPGEERK